LDIVKTSGGMRPDARSPFVRARAPRSTNEKEEKGMNTTPLRACGGRLQSVWCGTGIGTEAE